MALRIGPGILPASALLLRAVVAVVTRRLLLRLVISDLAADDFSVKRQGLEHDVEALAILVLEGKPEVEPIVVLAFALDYGIRAVRRLLRLISVRHGNS